VGQGGSLFGIELWDGLSSGVPRLDVTVTFAELVFEKKGWNSFFFALTAIDGPLDIIKAEFPSILPPFIWLTIATGRTGESSITIISFSTRFIHPAFGWSCFASRLRACEGIALVGGRGVLLAVSSDTVADPVPSKLSFTGASLGFAKNPLILS
jgi:hypothetical protein